MPTVSNSTIVREILSADITLLADEVIRLAKAKGAKGSDAVIRTTVHNVRSDLNKKARRPAPSAARTTVAPVESAPLAAAPVPSVVAPVVATPAPAAPAAPVDLATVLANVALVNVLIGVCGGVEPARKAAEAVRACGGVDPFLLHLDLVAGIRAPAAS